MFTTITNETVIATRPPVQNQVELMKTWISTCRTSHPRCNITKAYTPTRLLDLNAFDGSEDIRLVSLGENAEIEYIALSYCWGPPETHSLTTTQQTLPDRLQMIPFADLSTTFKDTINLTRKLGIRYLWVDALCIIQHDSEDWTKESSSMAHVYGNAVCTLAALSASNGAEGCRINAKNLTHDSWSRPISRKREQLDITRAGINVRICADDFMVWDDEYNNEENPLNGRAWTMQERLLSARNISFSTKILLWECQTIKASSELPWTFIEPEKRTGTAYAWPMRLEANEDKTSAERRDEWYKIVEEFSSRKMKDPIDKLPALSGLASKFHSENDPGQYLAGIWEAHMPAALLWQPESDKSAVCERCKYYRAPRWSWAALDGPISYASQRLWSAAGRSDELPGDFDFKVYNVRNSLETATPDLFGLVKIEGTLDANLILSTTLLYCRMERPNPYVHAPRNLRVLYQGITGTEIIGAVYLDIEEEVEKMGRIFCLPIRGEPVRSEVPVPYELKYKDYSQDEMNGSEKMVMGLAVWNERFSASRYFRIGLCRWVKWKCFDDRQRRTIQIF